MKIDLSLSVNSDNLTLLENWSTEFKLAASSLICQFKNFNIKNFLLEKFKILDSIDDSFPLFEKKFLIDFEQSRSKRLGVFYTPPYLVSKIISEIQIKNYYSYLEPSVGTGNFIILLINKIMTDLPNYPINSLLQSIYGFEIDYEALEICKIRVLLELEKYYFIDENTYKSLNFYLTDFTVKPPFGFDFMNEFNSIYQDTPKLVDIKKNKKFDYILGNPPFITFYGRRSKKLSEIDRKYYLDNYDFIPNSVVNGKLNSYMFFIEHGLDLLNQNGHLIYLLDNSIYETSGYHIRKWILENFQIHSITKGLSDFDQVCSGQTIWHLIKSKPKDPVVIKDNNQTDLNQKFDQSLWLNTQNYQIDFQRQNSIVDKLNNYQKLDYYFPGKSIRTCCMLLNLTESFLATKEEYEQDHSGLIMPYLEGSKSLSNPDEPLRFEKYIKYDYQLQLDLSNQIKEQLEKEGVKNKKRIGLGQLQVYQAPKIFIRQSSNKLIAKFTTENFMANNSLYILTPIYSSFNREIWKDILVYTERLLCSKLYSYLAYKLNIIRSNVKQQPQIKISDLKQLPFVLDAQSNFFNHLLEVPLSNREKIDLIIYEYFGLDEQEINEIECFVHSL